MSPCTVAEWYPTAGYGGDNAGEILASWNPDNKRI